MLATKLNVASAVCLMCKAQSILVTGRLNIVKLNGLSRYASHINKQLVFIRGFVNSPSSIRGYVTNINPEDTLVDSNGSKVSSQTDPSKTLASGNYVEPSDMFGVIGIQKYEKTMEDEAETKEYEFLKNEAKRPRRSTQSPGQYAQMIKKFITAGDMDSAMGVIDKVIQDRNQPNNYMYNLLIREFAVRGDLKQCFRLYNQMKKRDLKPMPATYTSLINACANQSNTKVSLEKLNELRQMFIEKGMIMNETQYKAMIKSYGHHGKILEAFELVDEMCDKKLAVDTETFNFLLHGTITQKDSGFRHALVTWHVMQRWKIKPDIYTYNLLLRAARDCKLGHFKIDDLFQFGPKKVEPHVINSDRPDLLASPPVISFMMPTVNTLNSSENATTFDISSTTFLPEKADEASLLAKTNVGSISNTSVSEISFDTYAPTDHLLLLGGFQNFVTRMTKDNVKPNIKTLTFLIELVPDTTAAENAVIKYAKANGINLDIDFYNILIRKRSFKFKYDEALEVLSLIQLDNLRPNIMTWGVIALTCRTMEQARELLAGMETSGHQLNIEIVGALLKQATHRGIFGLIFMLMEKMKTENLRPNKKIFAILDEFLKTATKSSQSKNSPDYVQKSYWKNGFRRFSDTYPIWREKMQSDSQSKKYK